MRKKKILRRNHCYCRFCCLHLLMPYLVYDSSGTLPLVFVVCCCLFLLPFWYCSERLVLYNMFAMCTQIKHTHTFHYSIKLITLRPRLGRKSGVFTPPSSCLLSLSLFLSLIPSIPLPFFPIPYHIH